LIDDALVRLEEWYQQRCDGSWENDHGVSIQSTDNPGWWVKIDLRGTELENKTFAEVKRGSISSLDPQPPWIRCYVENAVFNGAGDATTLHEIINTFLEWAEQRR
jgi:Immunity protein 53